MNEDQQGRQDQEDPRDPRDHQVQRNREDALSDESVSAAGPNQQTSDESAAGTGGQPPEQQVRRSDLQPAPVASAQEAEPEKASKTVVAQSDKQGAESATPEQEPEAVRQEQARPVDPASADDVLTKRMPGREAADAAVQAASRRHTRRSFLLAGTATAASIGFYKWLDVEPADDMQPGLLRRTFQANAALSRSIDRGHVLTPTYPLSRAETLRVNGTYGLKMELIPESWRLQLVGVQGDAQRPGFVRDVTAWEYRYTARPTDEDQGHDTKVDPKMTTAQKMVPGSMVEKAQQDENHTGRKPRGMEEAGESDSTLAPNTPGLLITMKDILSFPRHELVTQFKCIEGWSQIVNWAGIRLVDFLEAYPPALIDGKEPRYVYMETPDGDYYNGYDLDVCRHPQTLLVTEMMGAPLTQFHGAPLRLHMPTKYGYKQIKRIGLISYTNDKPDDYWTKLGYDWYAGL